MNTLFNNNTLCGFPYLFFRLILLFANFFSLIYVSDFYPPNRIDFIMLYVIFIHFPLTVMK